MTQNTLVRCKCGTEIKQVQDSPVGFYVKCKNCQSRTSIHPTSDAAMAEWADMNSANKDKPSQVEPESTQDFMEWCRRSRRGEFQIRMMEAGSRPGRWILHLRWPSEKPEVEPEIPPINPEP